MPDTLLTPSWLAREACYVLRGNPARVEVRDDRGFLLMYATATSSHVAQPPAPVTLSVPPRILKTPYQVAARYLRFALRGAARGPL
jgi:hypothetical protein